MLKTILLLQVLITNEVLAIDEIGDIEGGDKLIEKYRKLSKTKKLSESLILFKSENLKDKKLSKS